MMENVLGAFALLNRERILSVLSSWRLEEVWYKMSRGFRSGRT